MLDLLFKNCSTLNGGQFTDLAVDQGKIVQKGPELAVEARRSVDLQGRLVIPGFVESHIHLDLALMNNGDRPGRPTFFTSPSEITPILEARRKKFTREDIVARASQAVELASRQGVTALRAQCHVDQEVGLKHVEALLEVKQNYRNRVTMQIVTFPQQGLVNQPATIELMHEAFRLGADVMGCASNLDSAVPGVDGFKRHIDTAFAIAMQAGVDLDVHADLGLPRSVELDELEVVHLARRTIEYGYQGKVAAGHVCALDSASPETARQAIELIRAADISVISQPDLYRLGRQDESGVRRGLTRVRQLLAAGVNVTYASNNVRDAYRPLGNFDLLEEGLILAYGAHMDTVSDLDTLVRMSTYNAARALRLNHYGLEVGDTADLVVLDAPSPAAALAGQVVKLYVVKNGALVAANWQKSELY